MRNKKKTNVYRALKIYPMYVKSQARTINCKVSISITFFKVALKGVCSVTNF